MDFIDHLRALAAQIARIQDRIKTEEATKNAMVMPFIQVLGYNVFDPHEVTPELVADVGTKKGEKVDYAILKGGKPIILFECKKCGGDLQINHASQLFRYFHVTEPRFGVLTNGLVYRFFSDLEKPNKMDETPFFEFNILDFKDRDVDELKKFAKATFNLETILANANELKYVRAIQNRISEWVSNPSKEFVHLLSADLLAGAGRRFTVQNKEQFTALTKRAFEQLIGARINERLKSAMTPDPLIAPVEPPAITMVPATSLEEIDGFQIVRSILREHVSPKRIVLRHSQSYCAVLLDDNNRKTLCRLRFKNREKLRLGVFNDQKEEEQFPLESMDDIFVHADKLKSTLAAYRADDASLAKSSARSQTKLRL